MQTIQSSDPHLLHLSTMKIKLEKNPSKPQAMAPSRSLSRSASELADPPSPFSSNPAHHPVSTPTTPSSASYACVVTRPATSDSPPNTPGKAKSSSKPVTPAAAAAAYYASLWSPRRLMQRAARAFRTSRSRRARSFKDAGDERGGSVSGKVSDVTCSVHLGGRATEIAGNDCRGGGGAACVQEEEQHPEAVPEKIIHEAKHHAPPPVVADDECGAKTTPGVADDECGAKTMPADGKETIPAAAEEVESPKKGAAPAPAPEAAADAEDLAGKFVTVVKEAIKKHEAEQGEKKAEGTTPRFQGSRVRSAMEARAESEQPRRRDAARGSNDVIEEARSKLLEMRQCSRVRALVGAFETVMDDVKKDAAGTPRQLSRRSA